MKQVNAEKYTIAWFKIAECVARGEREKALGVYRLLAHSIDDEALVKQLEGDILLSFEDKGAIEKYLQAIEAYKKKGKFLQAAAVSEHVFTLEQNWRHAIIAIGLYTQLNMREKVVTYCKIMIDQLLEQNNNKQLQIFLADLQEIDPEGYAWVQEYMRTL
jgi:hypothetical protein